MASGFSEDSDIRNRNRVPDIHAESNTKSWSKPSTSTGGATGNSSQSSFQSNSDSQKDDNATDGAFECNICLDTAKDAVVSMCGHLFCWPCLHTWLETRPHRQVCPVCKAGISKEKVVPLYGRNSTSQQDPREKLPPRPPGQRSEPENTGFPGFSMGNGFQVSFGIGAFPFGFFASNFNFNDGRPASPEPGSPQHQEEVFLSKLFLWIAVIFFIWLLIA